MLHLLVESTKPRRSHVFEFLVNGRAVLHNSTIAAEQAAWRCPRVRPACSRQVSLRPVTALRVMFARAALSLPTVDTMPIIPACSRQVRNWLLKVKATACIPPRKNRKVQFEYDTELYKTRNIIERMFNRIKDWRQLSLRTFRCPETFLAAAQLAAVVIWLL